MLEIKYVVQYTPIDDTLANTAYIETVDSDISASLTASRHKAKKFSHAEAERVVKHWGCNWDMYRKAELVPVAIKSTRETEDRMNDKKYGVVYRNLPGNKGLNHYISRPPLSDGKPLLSLLRATTCNRKYAAAMSLAEASEVAHRWNEFRSGYQPASIISLDAGLEEAIDEEEALQYPEPDAVAMELHAEAVRLQPDEKAALQHLTNFWNAYLALPHRLDLSQLDPHAAVRNAVNAIQHVMAVRVAKRVDPDVWQ